MAKLPSPPTWAPISSSVWLDWLQLLADVAQESDELIDLGFTSYSYTATGNLTATVTTTLATAVVTTYGGPVVVAACGSVGGSFNHPTQKGGELSLRRGASTLTVVTVANSIVAQMDNAYLPTTFYCVDTPAAGTYTFKLIAAPINGGLQGVLNCTLMTLEFLA